MRERSLPQQMRQIVSLQCCRSSVISVPIFGEPIHFFGRPASLQPDLDPPLSGIVCAVGAEEGLYTKGNVFACGELEVENSIAWQAQSKSSGCSTPQERPDAGKWRAPTVSWRSSTTARELFPSWTAPVLDSSSVPDVLEARLGPQSAESHSL